MVDLGRPPELAITFKTHGGHWRREPMSKATERRFTLELCDKKGAYEVTPEVELEIDLDQAEADLADYGFTVLTNAGVLLVAQAGPIEVSVFESGRLLLKTGDAGMAEKATEATYEALGVLDQVLEVA